MLPISLLYQRSPLHLSQTIITAASAAGSKRQIGRGSVGGVYGRAGQIVDNIPKGSMGLCVCALQSQPSTPNSLLSLVLRRSAATDGKIPIQSLSQVLSSALTILLAECTGERRVGTVWSIGTELLRVLLASLE